MIEPVLPYSDTPKGRFEMLNSLARRALFQRLNVKRPRLGGGLCCADLACNDVLRSNRTEH